MHLLSLKRLIIKALPGSGVWVLGGESQPRGGGEDGTNQAALTGSGRMSNEGDDTRHLEVRA